MGYFGTEEQKFINGEIRTDGFKSGWRIEQERRRAEEMGKRQFVKAPQTKRPQIARTYSNPEHRREIVRKSMEGLRSRLLAEGICRDCQKRPVKQDRTSCQPCLTARYERQKMRRAELKEAA